MYSNDALGHVIEAYRGKKVSNISFKIKNHLLYVKHLDDLVDRRFEVDSVIGQNDTLIVVVEDEPNDGLITRLKQLYEQEGKFVVVRNIDRLQYHFVRACFGSKGRALTEQETSNMKQKYNIKLNNQFQEFHDLITSTGVVI